MEAWGFISAVVADAEGMILAGHARVLAAKKLGLTQVPVILADHLTEAEKMAFAIADIEIALHAGWDFEQLKVQLETLKAEKIDLTLVEFDQDELDRIVDKLERDIRAVDEDSVPEVGPAVNQLDDLWELGDHRLLCGDGTKSESFSVLLDGETADMVFTDPPYNVAFGLLSLRMETFVTQRLPTTTWEAIFRKCSRTPAD
jgi:16S rRNA G966 N2-methylase RsmD